MVFYYGKQCLPYDILLIIRYFLTRIDHKLSMAVWAGYIYFALMAREAKRFFAILAFHEFMGFALLKFIVLKFEKAFNFAPKLKPACIFLPSCFNIF